MSYRIKVCSEAEALLRSLRPHAVLRIGRALAEVAEALPSIVPGEQNRLRVDGYVLAFALDREGRVLEITGVEEDASAPALGSGEAAP